MRSIVSVLVLFVVAACNQHHSGDNGSSGATGSGNAAVDDPKDSTTFTGSSIRPGDVDMGTAEPSAPFRTLMVLPIHDFAGLNKAVKDMYTPGNASFRKYLSAADFNATYAPPQADVDALSTWIAAKGMKVERVAANRLLVWVSGQINQFNAAFGVQLHAITRQTYTLFATTDDKIPIPAPVLGKLAGVLTIDEPADTGNPDTAGLDIDKTPPGPESAGIATVLSKYDAEDVPAHGEGETIGIVGAGAVRINDGQSFWQSQRITRSSVVVEQMAESPKSINFEASLDIQWSGGCARGAGVRFYQGADIRDTSLVWAFNEAVGRGEVTVINDSYAHNETVEPIGVRVQYDRSSLAGAALGITVVSSSGDTAKVDAPGASPYVLSVGGANRDNSVWNGSGGGQSTSFLLPDWQKGIVFDHPDHRATPDVAGLADDLWAYSEGYSRAGGTSFSSPLMAGLFATLNSIRTKAGKPRVGWINSILYTTKAVQETFKDVSVGESGDNVARSGWDYASGWGTPDIGKLANAIP